MDESSYPRGRPADDVQILVPQVDALLGRRDHAKIGNETGPAEERHQEGDRAPGRMGPGLIERRVIRGLNLPRDHVHPPDLQVAADEFVPVIPASTSGTIPISMILGSSRLALYSFVFLSVALGKFS